MTPQPQTGGCLSAWLTMFFVLMLNIYSPFVSERTRGEYRQESCACVLVDVQTRGQERFVGAEGALGAVTSLCGWFTHCPTHHSKALHLLVFNQVSTFPIFSFFRRHVPDCTVADKVGQSPNLRGVT